MADQQWLAAAAQKIHQARAENLHVLARVGKTLDQLMQEQGWGVPKTLGYFRHINRPLPISLAMAVLVVRLYRQAPTWADNVDQIQLRDLPSDLAGLVELVEEQSINDVSSFIGIPPLEAADG